MHGEPINICRIVLQVFQLTTENTRLDKIRVFRLIGSGLVGFYLVGKAGILC